VGANWNSGKAAANFFCVGGRFATEIFRHPSFSYRVPPLQVMYICVTCFIRYCLPCCETVTYVQILQVKRRKNALFECCKNPVLLSHGNSCKTVLEVSARTGHMPANGVTQRRQNWRRKKLVKKILRSKWEIHVYRKFKIERTLYNDRQR